MGNVRARNGCPMIVSEETTDDGQVRFYFTRQNSVQSYVTDDGEGGVQIHVEPSEFACPWSTTPEKMQAVRLSLLAEAAQRLGCKVDQVETLRLADFRTIADPQLSTVTTGPAAARCRRAVVAHRPLSPQGRPRAAPAR